MSEVRIQDDLFTYVNQETLDKLVIPDDKPTAGGFQTLAEDVEKLMIGEFNQMCESDAYPNDYVKNACKLFKVIKNVEKRDADGYSPAPASDKFYSFLRWISPLKICSSRTCPVFTLIHVHLL